MARATPSAPGGTSCSNAGHGWGRSAGLVAKVSRTADLTIFPEAVRGRPPVRTTDFGILYVAK